MEPIEQKNVINKRYSLLLLSKLILVITIIIGLTGVLSVPPPERAFGPGVVNNTVIWFMGLLTSLYLIFIFMGTISYMWFWKKGDNEKMKVTKKFIIYSIVGFVILMIFYPLSVTIEVYR